MIRTKRWILALALTLAPAGCGTGDEPAADLGGDSPRAAEGEDVDVPETVTEEDLSAWDVRFDDASAEASGFQITEGPGGGLTIVTGPAGIAWRSSDLVEGGPFSVSATVEERDAPPEHREAYGLLFGGRNLEDPDQRYSYFVIRGTGDYLIKRREGEATPTLVDWTPSDAIRPGQNTLEVRVAQDSVRFTINGTEVETLPAEQVQPYGIAGLRVNHMLDVAVTSFAVSPGGAAPR